MTQRRPPREWSTYQYFDVRDVLIKLGEVEKALAGRPIAEKVLRLRTQGLREFHERRQAAIFCYGMSCLHGGPIQYAPVESADFDCIARWRDGDILNYAPIQTKELVPADLNPTATLDEELKKLTKYVDSSDLVVAFYLNRNGRIEFPTIRVPRLNVAELWMFWATSPDKAHWMLYGDVLKAPRAYAYEYPT